MADIEEETLEARVRSLNALYSGSDADAAFLLCDRHDRDAVAYRILGPVSALTEISYGALADSSSRVAAGMAKFGIGPGDRVATLMGKSAEYLTTLIAIWRLGAVHVPLFTAFAPPAIAFRLSASACKLVVCDDSQRPKLLPGPVMPDSPPWRVLNTGNPSEGDISFADLAATARVQASVALGGDAPFIQIYTSGTTGTPKGVVVPIRALASFQAYAEFGLDLQPDDVFWNAADPGWGYGLYFGVLAALTTGCAGLFVSEKFSAESTFDVLATLRVTNFAAAPTVYRSLRVADQQVPSDLSLRCASSAGEPLTPEVNEWAEKALGVVVRDHFGQTEAGMLINNHHHRDLKRTVKPGSMGRSMPGWKATVLHMDQDVPAAVGETGRLAMDLTESPLAWFAGYADDAKKSAEKFSADGRWYLTGDVAHADADGDFHFAARDDDVIIMAGYRIGPFEVESVILSHPAVAECAVVAIPDEVRGEVLAAAVLLRHGFVGDAELAREIKEIVKTGYAAHAYPRIVDFVDGLPKTPSGKVQRFVVREDLKRRYSTKSGGPS